MNGCPESGNTFDQWVRDLRILAAGRECEWLATGIGASHREAWAAGISPADHLDALERMAEWRGCGCGGG